MIKMRPKFGVILTTEKDIDQNYAILIIPSAEATPTDPVN